MKGPLIDMWIWLLALLLACAMALTLWYGQRGGSRHGYGTFNLTIDVPA